MTAAARWIEARPTLTRWLLGAPGTLLAALLSMGVMPLWLPAGEAGVNNLAFPIVLAPLIWAAVFFYAVLDRRLTRAALVICGLIVVQTAIAAGAFL